MTEAVPTCAMNSTMVLLAVIGGITVLYLCCMGLAYVVGAFYD